MATTKNTAQARFDDLSMYRSIYLRRAVDCSQLTIPSLIPESDQNYQTGAEPYNRLLSLYQGAGARGVSSISAKLLLALYPPSQPFFRLVIDKGQIRSYLEKTGQAEDDVVSQLDVALSDIERQILGRLDKLQTRPALFEAIKHLIVGGNALLYVGKENLRMWSLRSYVVDRDPEGNVSEIVVKETVSDKYLPDGEKPDEDSASGKAKANSIYTHVQFNATEDRVEWHQEFRGKTVKGSQGFSRIDNCPWLVLRLHKIAGESYGRSLCEEVLGDLNSLESLSKAIVEGSLISAKAMFLVNPNGVTRADSLARAENGAIVAGNAADVEALQVGKAADMSVALQTIQLLERRISFTFLMNESVQRDAERVTAEEIRLMAEQLESGLAGVYSMLSQELQLPLIKRVLFLMEQAGEIPPIPVGLVNPQVTTGLEAIGRGNDKQRLTNFLQVTSAALGPEQMLSLINPSELIRRFAASDGIDIAGLVKSEEELQAEQSQQQRVALEQQLASNAASSGALTPPTPTVPAGGPTPAAATAG